MKAKQPPEVTVCMRDISDSVMWKPIETTVITEQGIDLPHNRNSGEKADVKEGKIWKWGQQGSHSEYCPTNTTALVHSSWRPRGKRSSLRTPWNEERTHKPGQFFLLPTESLSSPSCSRGRWNITVLHPSLGLISSLADSVERKAKCWLSQREWHLWFLQEPAAQGKPGLSLPLELSSIPWSEGRLQNKSYSFQLHYHPLLSEIRNMLFWPLWSHSNRENNSLSILPCRISGSWKPFTSKKFFQQLPWWLW